MAVRRDPAPGSASAQVIGASRVLLLVRGTSETTMSPIADGQELSQQHFKVESKSASCLLSDTPARVNLVGYCDFGKMLAYRLDKEAALVLASAVDFSAPGSASAADAAGLAAGSSRQSPCPHFHHGARRQGFQGRGHGAYAQSGSRVEGRSDCGRCFRRGSDPYVG